MQVSPVQTEKAVKALLAHHTKTKERRQERAAAKATTSAAKPASATGSGKRGGKADKLSEEAVLAAAAAAGDLLDDEDYVWLMVGFRKVPETPNSHKPRRIEVRHRVFKEDAQVCLITKDPQRTYKDAVKEKGLDMVAKVVGISKLKAKYRPFEAKRNLCNAYDVFLADDSVVHYLPKALGKTFFEKKKNPIPVPLKPSTIDKEVRKALASTYVFLGKGSSTAIRVGRTTQSAVEIAENVEDVVAALRKMLPKKGQHVQSMGIKTSASTSLPIYAKAPEAPGVIEA